MVAPCVCRVSSAKGARWISFSPVAKFRRRSARIGLCEYVVEHGGARDKAEELAHQIARFPQACVRADRRSARKQHGLPLRSALMQEWKNSCPILETEGIAGAGRFAGGIGRHGDFDKI